MSVAPRYGIRDSYSKESRALLTRPDGTTFVQNDRDTYRRTLVPMVQPPETRSNRLEGVNRRQGKEGTMINTLGQAQLDLGTLGYTEVARYPSANGKAWLIELRGPGGKLITISRLRASREGNGF